MRAILATCFDSIYVVNLHGNSNLLETHPDGSLDENVFDIRQGVSINIFVKTSNRKSSHLAIISHFDLYGTRESKYKWLGDNSIGEIDWNLPEVSNPHYFFVPKDFGGEELYSLGFRVNDLYPINSTGIKTHRNGLVIGEDRSELESRLRQFTDKDISDEVIRQIFDLRDNRDWKLSSARQNTVFDISKLVPYVYTPFDFRFIYYEKLLIDFARENVMKHFLGRSNLALVLPKQGSENECSGASIVSVLCDHKCFSAYNTNNVFPLYVYSDSTRPTLDGRTERVPNLNSEIVDKIAAAIGLTFVAEPTGAQASLPARRDSVSGTSPNTTITPEEAALQAGMPALQSFAPIDILDYIYAVLHSPSYREKYKEFLKIDFPRVPYPKDAATFWELVALGGELRQIHLLESPKVNQFITGFPVGGDNMVKKIAFVTGARGTLLATPDRASGAELSPTPSGGIATDASKDACAPVGDVHFNETQHFANVPEIAWNFYIGGYQPAQKWLKDRKGRKLSYDDINHYQKIIVALTETDRIMKEIDKINFID